MAQTNETYVVDASVVVKWFLDDEKLNEHTLILWRRQNDGLCLLVAPAHIHCEVPNAITFAARRNPPRLSVDDGRTLVDQFLRIRLQTVPTNQLVAAAYDLAHGYRISIYDALYLALALDYDIPIVTADAKFHNRVATLPNIRWLGDLTDD